MRIEIYEDRGLPKLGWIAHLSQSCARLTVCHGAAVERGDGWIVEGVWDGPFDGRFDESEHFFGSGVVVADGHVTFVSSCALVDRLVCAEIKDGITVSNSLALLLGATGGRLVPDGRRTGGLYAILTGIDRYDDRIRTTGAMIRQLYYHNLVVTREGQTRTYKAEPRRIGTFQQYRELITHAIRRIGQNLTDPRRSRGVQPLATISRGYDSPAVCALARDAGLKVSYTCRRSNSLIPRIFSRAAAEDDGTPIASVLGLEARPLNACDEEELYFLGGSDEPEFAFGSLVEDVRNDGRVAALFTGYHGDMIWRVDAFDDERGVAIIRHDVSGLNLCEIRLAAGFINVPLTFLYARSQSSIGRMARSEEMAPWRTWTDYDRPIPRRLLMEAGVDGNLFGQRKKAIVERPLLPVTDELREDFLHTLTRESGYRRSTILGSCALDALMEGPQQAARRVGFKKRTLCRPADIRSRLYAWAANRLAAQYKDSALGLG